MRFVSLALVPLFALAACAAAPLPPLSVTSSAFAQGAAIPVAYTCDGRNILPPMSVDGAPRATKALGVLMRDLDAEGGPALHLAMWNIDEKTAAWSDADPPLGAVYGQNDAGITGYSGPCRALDKAHHYEFVVYALDAPLRLKPGASRAEIETAFADHAIAKGTLTGLYGEARKAGSGAVL